MVLTPQLLQAIKLLQMPNLELTQFIENELASNPAARAGGGARRAEPRAGRAASRRLCRSAAPNRAIGRVRRSETDTGHLAANLGTEVENTFDADRTAPAIQSASADDPERERLDRRRRRPRHWRGSRPRSLCRRDGVASRPSRASGRDPASRSGRAHHRRGADRRAGRGRLFRRLDSRNRRTARRRRSSTSSACSCACRPWSRRGCSRARSPSAWPFSSRNATASIRRCRRSSRTCRRSPGATFRCCAASAASTTRICAT